MTELEDIIHSEIDAAGVMPFARFMELALYHPRHGYYERHLKQTGRGGDFYTSVSVGSLYGEFLGFEFARRLMELPAGPLQLVEAGAHDGRLAGDLLRYLAEYQPDIFQRLSYIIIEPSPSRAERQAQMLKDFSRLTRWARSWADLPEFRGICFSNELLDAMPVNVFRWESKARDWTEWGVTCQNGHLQWEPLPRAAENQNARRLLARLPEALQTVLPQDFTIEISPDSVSWWLRAAHALTEGWLVTVDYGLLQEDFFQPHRARGTLRAYSRHHLNGNVLESAGEQDITAHVNFSLLISAGESAGLKTEEFVLQGIFIKSILERIEARPDEFPLWTPMRYRQLTTLTHPEHLGRAFKILVQSRR